MPNELAGLQKMGLATAGNQNPVNEPPAAAIEEENQNADPVEQTDEQHQDSDTTNQLESSGEELEDSPSNEGSEDTGEEEEGGEEDDYDWSGLDGLDNDADEELADLQENERVFLNDVHEELGIKATSMTELKGKLKDILTENTKLKTRAEESEVKVFANDQLRRANDYAKNGGDYLEYLKVSQTDWDVFTDEELFRARVAPHFTDANGNINVEELNDYIDSVDDMTIKIQGSTERTNRKQEQESRMRQMEHEAIEHKRQVDLKFRDELSKIDELFGLKVTPADKKAAHKNITSGDFIRETFYDKNGQTNYRRIIENEFLRRKIKDIVKVNAQRALSKGKKEILDEATNTNIKPKSNSEIPKFTKKKEHSVEQFMKGVASGQIKIR